MEMGIGKIKKKKKTSLSNTLFCIHKFMQFYNKSILSTLYTNFIDEETEFQDVLSNFLSLKSVSARARI